MLLSCCFRNESAAAPAATPKLLKNPMSVPLPCELRAVVVQRTGQIAMDCPNFIRGDRINSDKILAATRILTDICRAVPTIKARTQAAPVRRRQLVAQKLHYVRIRPRLDREEIF